MSSWYGYLSHHIQSTVRNSVVGIKSKSTMTTRLQLSLSAKGLKNLSGIMQKSDPFAVVTVRGDNPDNRPEVVGRTDVYVARPPCCAVPYCMSSLVLPSTEKKK